MSWCTIESDPGVFTELISEIGVKGVQVDELYGLETETIAALKPVYGLIFLFKWQKDDSDKRAVLADGESNVFFAKQVISNACATQAIISVLLNRPELDLGEELKSFKDFTQHLPSDMRGLAIGNSAQIRLAHNSFARPEPFVSESKAATEDDDVFHFIGYVPVDGKVYELDGLKEGPVLLGECPGGEMDKWYEVAAPAIQERIARYSAKEIRFNLLALRQKPKDVMTKALSGLESQEAAVKAKLEGKELMQDDDAAPLPTAKAELEALLKIIPVKKAKLESDIKVEDAKYAAWKVENVRRKHNYVPLALNLLKILAKNGKLQPMVEQAKKDLTKAQAEKAKKEKEKSGDKTDKAPSQ